MKKHTEIKDISYFLDNGLSIQGYYDQFVTVKTVELNKVYRRKGPIYWTDYKIIFIGEGVALGVEVANGNNNFGIGDKVLFYAEGSAIGWKYQDNRPIFRLQEISPMGE